MKLVKMLQKAHAGELAASIAYQGHWESVSDPEQREMIKKIQADEIEHLHVVRKMLEYLGYQPNKTRDTIFMVIGHTLGFLCKYTGWLMPMQGALLIEKIGVSNYYEMLELSLYTGHSELALTFMHLMAKEEKHKEYFESLLSRPVKSV
jgi:rubrerythrin